MLLTGPGHQRLPSPIHQLTATVCAPACALSSAGGQIRASGMHGLFLSDVRVLSQAQLFVGDAEPQTLARLHDGPGRTRFAGVALGLGDDGTDPTIRLDRIRQARPDGMDEKIHLRSTATVPVHTTVTLQLRADLTPLELVKQGHTRSAVAAYVDGQSLGWADGHMAITVTGTHPQPATADLQQLIWPIDLPPGGELTLSWSLHVHERSPALVTPAGDLEWSRPQVSSDDPRLNRLLHQALDDLQSLRLAEAAQPGNVFLAAGAPWFLTLFGRDSIWAAKMMLPLGTELAHGTLQALARRQGTLLDAGSGQAPGKIMHELRHEDTRVRIGGAELPAAYYGTVDATLLWISLLAEAWRWGLPEHNVAALLPHLGRALSWLQEHGDPDGDGFIEYLDHSGRGLANQGWKDSGDAVRFHNGTLGQTPIALCEVQGYAHRAALDAAALLDAFSTPTTTKQTWGNPDQWRHYAAQLSHRFRQQFWVNGPLGPYPAMAIDGNNKPVDSLTSNIGHLLGTGLLTTGEESTVAALLADPALCSGYGLRTMSTLDTAYNPLSYHNGSIWPHDTAIALHGLATAGAHPAAVNLITGLLAAAEAFDYRLPELYAGDPRDDLHQPLAHPRACQPQAWSAAAAITIVQALLGITADLPNNRIHLNPLTGHTLGTIHAHGLQIAGHPIDITIDRSGTVTATGIPDTIAWHGPINTPAPTLQHQRVTHPSTPQPAP